MKGQPYVAVVRKCHACPVGFAGGERMTLVLPGLSKEESERVCALALLDIVPAIRRAEKAGGASKQALESGKSVRCTGCKAIDAFVEFEVRSAAPADSSARFVDGAILEAIKRFELFAPLPSRSLTRIVPLVRPRAVADGEVVVRRGERGERLYLLAKGEVDVLAPGDEELGADAAVVATLGAGEVFGEIALLTGEPVSATIRARGAGELLTIEKADFEKLLGANPGLNLYFTKLLAERLKKSTARIGEELDRGFSGQLHLISPAELVQALDATAKSGTLRAESGGCVVEVVLQEGRIHSIASRGLEIDDPEEAFYELLSWTKGTFDFEPGAPAGPRTFFKETTSLLLEGLRRIDEASAPG